MSGSGFAVQAAMRAALLADGPLIALLGGANVHEEMPRGAKEPFVGFGPIETRDRSVSGQKGHEHFVTLEARTNQRGRRLAQDIAAAIEAALDDAGLGLDGHRLINLRLVFWTVHRDKSSDNFNATLRFRAATEVEEAP